VVKGWTALHISSQSLCHLGELDYSMALDYAAQQQQLSVLHIACLEALQVQTFEALCVVQKTKPSWLPAS
jgi:hypothetical protein